MACLCCVFCSPVTHCLAVLCCAVLCDSALLQTSVLSSILCQVYEQEKRVRTSFILPFARVLFSLFNMFPLIACGFFFLSIVTYLFDV
eukprot:m.27361 g.27361  ORF g.27361 m.27361 type:complete len:88 (+) comp10234_c1_seq1:109-372(+)